MRRGTPFLVVICTILMTTFFFSLMGCNTVKGVGKDIEAGGKAIQKAAN